MNHTHDWKPIPNECGRYVCACTVVGRRERGGIVPYVNQPVPVKHFPAAARISRFTADEREHARVEIADPRRWQNPEFVR